MNLPEGSKLPVLPDELIESKYKVAVTTPRSFVRQTVVGFTDTRPYLIHSYLVDALRFSANYGEYETLQYLRQVLFIPACLDEYYRVNQMPKPRISKNNLQSLYSELAGLDSDERELRDSSLQRRVREHNNLLAEHTGHLHDLSTLEGVPDIMQSQALKKAFRAFELYERQVADPSQSSPELDYGDSREELPTDPIPLVRSAIVDQALLAIALDKTEFTKRASRELGDPLSSYLAISSMFVDKVSYQLVSSLINRVFVDEFIQRGLQIPEVAFDTVSTNSQEVVQTMETGTEPLKVIEETR